MVPEPGGMPFQNRTLEQQQPHGHRGSRNDDPLAIAVMIGFFTIMLFIGIGLMWVFTPTRHSEPVIGHGEGVTSVPGDQISSMHLR